MVEGGWRYRRRYGGTNGIGADAEELSGSRVTRLPHINLRY
jgi:hypothetical protein